MRIWDRLRRLKKSKTPPTIEGAEPSVSPVSDEPSQLAPMTEDLISDAPTGRLRFGGLKARANAFFNTVKTKFPKNLDDLRRLQSDEAVERMRQLFSGKAYGTYVRLGAAAFAAYFMADTVSLFTDSFIPDPPNVPTPRVSRRDERRSSIDEYSAITARNIFNSKGLIPEEEGNLANGPARKTNLPLNLIGTVVLADELKSIAAIEDKSQNMVFPVRIDDTINDRIKITKIEHLRVTFLNKSTGHMEYVEILEDAPMFQNLRPSAPSGPKKPSGSGVTQTDENHFDVDRTAVDKAVSNLSQVLQEARAIPNFENGVPDGYKILQIVPGSIYDQLGIKNGDVVTSINGESINDPGKAFQLFNELKTTSHLEIGVKRGGQKTTKSYDIR